MITLWCFAPWGFVGHFTKLWLRQTPVEVIVWVMATKSSDGGVVWQSGAQYSHNWEFMSVCRHQSIHLAHISLHWSKWHCRDPPLCRDWAWAGLGSSSVWIIQSLLFYQSQKHGLAISKTLLPLPHLCRLSQPCLLRFLMYIITSFL